MDRPMTTTEFFEKIRDNLRNGGMMPKILDYALADSHGIPIKTDEFYLMSRLDYGGSEGIYLDLWIVYYEDDENRRASLGTFKTLEDSREAMRTMGILLADFLVEGYSFVRKNSDDFIWTGFRVRVLDGNGNGPNWHYSCNSEEDALKRKDKLLETYPAAVIRNNATRKETTWRAGSKGAGTAQ